MKKIIKNTLVPILKGEPTLYNSISTAIAVLD